MEHGVYTERRLKELAKGMQEMRVVEQGVEESSDEDDDVTLGESSGVERGSSFSDFMEVVSRVADIDKSVMTQEFRKGRAVVGDYGLPDGELLERRFLTSGCVTIVSSDQVSQAFGDLLEGRKFLEVGGSTSVGKTTDIPRKLVDMGMRVLVLEHDTTLVVDVRGFVRSRGEKRVRVNVSGLMDPRLIYMTYGDFRGAFRGSEGRRLLSALDVVYMDECHMPRAAVKFVRAVMATVTGHRCSLLAVTATPLKGASAQVMKPIAKKVVDKSLIELVRERAFGTEFFADRNMLIFGLEHEAHEAIKLLEADGLEVHALDSLSKARHVARVRRIFQGDSCVPRVLVSTNRFGYAYSLPVTNVFSDECRQVYVRKEDGTVVTEVVPVTVAEAEQFAGRLSRGMAPDGVYYACRRAGSPSANVEMLPTQSFEYYLSLRAAGIQPLSKPPASFLPFGVSPSAAVDLLASGLPPAIAIRYMGRDGKFPAAYAKALDLFCENDHVFAVSKYAVPLMHNQWPLVRVGGVFDLTELDSEVAVPFVTDDENVMLRLMAIGAIAEGKVPLCSVHLEVEDLLSDAEGAAQVAGNRRVLPRRRAPSPGREVVHVRQEWVFDVDDKRKGKRRGVVAQDLWDPEVIRQLREADGETVVERPTKAVDVDSLERGVAVVLTDEAGPVEISSPGGSVVCTLPATIWFKLVDGLVMTTEEVIQFADIIRSDPERFAHSRAFANWSNVWLGLLTSVSDKSVWRSLQRHAYDSAMGLLLAAMYSRYMYAVERVVSTSVVKTGFWQSLLRRSFDEGMSRARKKGRVEVVQSEAFFSRVHSIRQCFAGVLMAAEEFGVFQPVGVTAVQQQLPIQQSTGYSVVDGAASRRARNQMPVAQGGRRMRLVGGKWREVAGSGTMLYGDPGGSSGVAQEYRRGRLPYAGDERTSTTRMH